MSNPKGPSEITGDAELDLALHVYMTSDAYRAYDAVRTPEARLVLEQSEAHKAYKRIVELYVLRENSRHRSPR